MVAAAAEPSRLRAQLRSPALSPLARFEGAITGKFAYPDGRIELVAEDEGHRRLTVSIPMIELEFVPSAEEPPERIRSRAARSVELVLDGRQF